MKPSMRAMRLVLPVVAGALLACGEVARDRAPVATTRASRPAAELPYLSEPTPEVAGAERCTLVTHDLGRLKIGPVIDPIVTGFGPRGGLAVWGAERGGLALRPLARDGRPLAGIAHAQVPAGFQLARVTAFDGGFVAIGRRYSVRGWSALVTDERGRPRGPAFELDLASRLVDDAIGSGRAVILLASSDIYAPRPAPARWLTLEIAADGSAAQRGSDLTLDVVRPGEHLRRATVGGKPAWLVARASGRDELVHDATVDAADPSLLALSDPIELTIAIDRLVTRTVAGKSLGRPIQLPAAAAILGHTWSGAFWVFAAAEAAGGRAATAQIVLVHCRP